MTDIKQPASALSSPRFCNMEMCIRDRYMTVNTLFKEDELEELENYMRPYCDRGLDGVIVQDLGALAFMRRHFPGLELHSSTQMTVTSVYGARTVSYTHLAPCMVSLPRQPSFYGCTPRRPGPYMTRGFCG